MYRTMLFGSERKSSHGNENRKICCSIIFGEGRKRALIKSKEEELEIGKPSNKETSECYKKCRRKVKWENCEEVNNG